MAESGSGIQKDDIEVDDLKFAEELRKFPVLYNVNLASYRNRRAKDNAYAEIAKVVGVSIGKKATISFAIVYNTCKPFLQLSSVYMYCVLHKFTCF